MTNILSMLVITMGDAAGVGPEIVARALALVAAREKDWQRGYNDQTKLATRKV